jgi:putative transport protein
VEIDLFQVIKDNGLILLFLVIGLGYLIGNARVFGIPIGATIGVLLVGLFFGHHGLTMSPAVGTFGFALFIFSVGLQAGPSFFSAFLEDGRKYFVLAAIVALVGLGSAITLSQLFGFTTGFNAGLMAGALTSTPTLAAAQDAVNSGLGGIDEDSRRQILENIGVGYALTYLVGTILVILVIRYAPRLLKMNLEAMARTYARDKGLLVDRRDQPTTAETLPIVRAYRITPESHGKTISQRTAELSEVEGVVLKVKRGNELLNPDPKLEMQEGDILSIIASLHAHQWAQKHTDIEEVLDADLLNYHVVSHEIVVLNSHVLGKTIKDLDLTATYGCFATGLNRSGVNLPVTDEVVLAKGDRVDVVGEESHLRRLASQLGHIEQDLEETDLVTFSLGIALGTFVGLVTFSVGGIAIGLGTAGGLLITGLGLGYVSSINPTFGRVPGAARFLLKELGLMLLMASIGLNAGGGIVDGMLNVGLPMLASAVVVSMLPLALGYLIGRKVLKMNPVLLLGSLTGAMTSTPALATLNEAAKSSVPSIGYAGTYTFANVFLTFAGTFLMTL